jgi:Aspartyl protease
MPIIQGNAKHAPPIVTVSIIPALPSPVFPGQDPQISKTMGVTCRALLDTGADGTSVNRQVAEAAGLLSRGKTLVTGIGGQNYHRAWATYVGFFPDPNQAGFPFVLEEPLLAIEMPAYHAFEVIIGRDILLLGDFVLRSNGEFSLTLPD